MATDSVNVLTINGGSSSIKFALYNMGEQAGLVYSGKIERIGSANAGFSVTQTKSHEKNSLPVQATNFHEAADFLIGWLEQQPGFGDIKCIGHRIVHGLKHTHAEIVGDDLLKDLNSIVAYDPDHLPAEIDMVQTFKKRYPGILQVACFDTAFHAAMPRIAKILPVPRRFDEAGIQRYGFHGLSYSYLMEALTSVVGSEAANGRVILAHLGNGASLAAVTGGKSIDTTMAFTPVGGLVMGTRSGDLDPGLAWYIMQSEKMGPEQFNNLINHESGLLGISETSSDMQDLLKLENTDVRAAEALGVFCYSVKKWIGAFAAALGGLDTLVFSGGIGENATVIRSRICERLGYLGIDMDEEQNKTNAPLISKAGSAVQVRVIPTNEELMIAKSAAGIYRECVKYKPQS